MQYWWVGIGSALGGMARLWLSLALAPLMGGRLHWPTFVINLLGSFVIGLVASADLPGARLALPVQARVFLTVGVCGGFTTFSSFSLQSVSLLQRGEAGTAALYVAVSVMTCALGSWAGLMLGRA